MNRKYYCVLVVAIAFIHSNCLFSMKLTQKLPFSERRGIDLSDIPSKDAPFSEIAEYVKTKYYLAPYNSKQQLGDGDIPRAFHGGEHVMRVSLLIKFLMNFYKKHGYDKQNPEAAKWINSEGLIRKLRIVGLLHDAGRMGEGRDIWEQDSKDACCEFLQNNQRLTEDDAESLADIVVKPRRREDRTFAQHILATADAIDIIRVRGFNGKKGERQYGYFNMFRLAPFKHLSENEVAKAELKAFIFRYRQMLKRQGDVWYPCPITPEEESFLKSKLQEYGIPQIEREEYISEKIFFEHVLAGREDVSEKDRAKLYLMDRCYSVDKKRAYEFSPDCYRKLKADLAEILG